MQREAKDQTQEKQVYDILATYYLLRRSNEYAQAHTATTMNMKLYGDSDQTKNATRRIKLLLLSFEFMRNFRMKSVLNEMKRTFNQSTIVLLLIPNNFLY